MSALAVAAGAVAVFAAGAHAQGPPAPVLNALQVRDLVENADPAAHARLEMHFATLANQYVIEAARQAAVRAALAGNPNRRMGPDSHAARLARNNARTAATLRQLAAHHARLAGGHASRPPIDAERFEDGDGATQPTPGELTALTAGRRPRYERRTVRQYFLTLARTYDAGVQTHRAMASAYRGMANHRGGNNLPHCERLIRELSDAAQQARAAATAYE
ncbi:MAG: hypothetical protein A3F70_13980 [Acidobacteria bacterium RIFCSPLOWO2_12_FULL_67_14]|nr:MAG: hypothetical protein A3H29_01455 [Acidobacteria bacterium RIFCSPLOWO2_02_FULL_67_21]OFW40617.1 MAG: hypothetical protein A3F70_13980 [Acidobacteria bacterium RIFCSPLOWO2_12_FULL_67_14]